MKKIIRNISGFKLCLTSYEAQPSIRVELGTGAIKADLDVVKAGDREKGAIISSIFNVCVLVKLSNIYSPT
jgi:hypothetical protein